MHKAITLPRTGPGKNICKGPFFGFAPLECAKYSESRTCDRAAAGAVPLACAAPARAGRRTALRSGARARAAAILARASSLLDRVRCCDGRGAGSSRKVQSCMLEVGALRGGD